jgi:large repetitive protein
MKFAALRIAPAIACAALLVSANAAYAVDGVLEINHTSILAAGGYPFNIAATGSYRLTGNLTPPAGTGALTIGAPGVEIDLNGFSLVGAGGAGDGILGGPDGLVVRNGAITGFGGAGIQLGAVGKVISVRIESNGQGGIGGVASQSLIENCIFRFNAALPAIIAQNSTIQNNVITFNSGSGISGNGNTIVHNRIDNNGATGVIADSSLIAENQIVSNSLAGIGCPLGGCTIRGNTIRVNGANGANVGPGSNVTENTISNNTLVGLNISNLAGFSNNAMAANGGAEVIPAGHPTRLFDNICDGAVCP